MFIKVITLEYDDSIKGDRRTSLILPLGHPLCQIYEPYEWSKKSAFVYKTESENEIWNIDSEIKYILSSWRHLYPGRIRYEMWICDVKNEFPIMQKKKIYILKAQYLINMMEDDYIKDDIIQATETHILSQGKKKLKNYNLEYVDIRKTRGYTSPECYYHAESIKLMTLKIEGSI